MDFSKKPMVEIIYRQSRIAKALGQPAKYSIIDFLLNSGPTSLDRLSKAIHRSKTTTCYHLSKLKSLELVRYETKTSGVIYWIKYEPELRGIIQALESYIKRAMKNIGSET
ncbi:hypothetical protein A2Y85_05320 [candidate division WOR-3 bacterium RBG_13_43_14]|uniref:HTH arsR-type domain-containing protein n=1 Tax=candidate division WOR-3 bacterium RBG_13_43_14 TaxID=1802590 RepID=A0A1F4U1T2_UNCW3|nr:MAG: hypothetical protein A2Y85_05320 [candidate division WOR-3 bacterium RBG_13_43_14]